MKIHLIGIGGIGVSALAQYYVSKGHIVTGSDLAASEITDFLKKQGIKVTISNSAENIEKDFDLVVFSPAVPPGNVELSRAKELEIKTQSYPEALGELTKEYYTIAISGSHGKSTTTAMLALALIEAGLDPTVIVGTKLKEFGGSNFRAGKGKYLIIEACEYDSSFLYYLPKVIVITNVDKEHLDYFKTFENVKKAFGDFVLQLPKEGVLVFNKDDENSKMIFKGKTIGYSLEQKEAEKMKNILAVPGKHNISNSLAVLETARILGVPDEVIFKSLAKFTGTWRRFEIKEGIANNKKITIVSDYGHHPNEILATLTATREKYPDKKIWCIFQPHQYQRTFYLLDDFVKVFQQVPIDQIAITDIYDVAGRETKTINEKVSSVILVEKIGKENIVYIKSADTENYVKENISNGDVLVIMGAGDIYTLVDKF